MKVSSRILLISCSGLMLLASAANASTVGELQSDSTNLRAVCNAEAGSLDGYDRKQFIRKCLIEKTSPDAKARSCEARIGVEISKRAQRDPETHKKWIESCVQSWDPKFK